MSEEYISDSEYEKSFESLGGLRSKIANDLPLKPGMRILDVATGEGYFAIEVARRVNNLQIIGIEISEIVIQEARTILKNQGIEGCIEFVKMDAADMGFGSREFDMAINFTGLDEIYMTRGEEGVRKTFFEVNKVLKPDRYFCFVVMPPEQMETEAQKLEVALFDHVCGAKYLSKKEYEAMLEEAKLKLVSERSYYSGMKFTPQQAKKGIRYTIKTDRERYGIETPPFEEVWTRFGKDIEKNGLGCYSKVELMIAQKAGDI